MRNIVDTEEWEERLKERRDKKDRFFKKDSSSPIVPQKQEGFEGLNYYPPNRELRFKLQLHEHDDKKVVEVDTTADNERDYVRWGEFRFELEGEQKKIYVYKREPEEESLFIPFRDSTSGDETYGAGRYIDLGEGKYLGEGKWIVDFNEAYNPWCAYSDSYSCPLPPPENWLDIPIKAGEKLPPLKE